MAAGAEATVAGRAGDAKIRAQFNGGRVDSVTMSPGDPDVHCSEVRK